MHHWDITFNTKGLHKQLSQLNTHKATGSDNVRTKRSCETQLIWTLHSIARRLKGVNQVDLVQLDFSKAFDKVPCRRLMYKLQYNGVRGSTAKWTQYSLQEVEPLQTVGIAVIEAEDHLDEGAVDDEQLLDISNLSGDENYHDVKYNPLLTDRQKKEAKALVREFQHIFTETPGTTHLAEHRIETTTNEPVRVKQ